MENWKFLAQVTKTFGCEVNRSRSTLGTRSLQVEVEVGCIAAIQPPRSPGGYIHQYLIWQPSLFRHSSTPYPGDL